MGYWIEPQKGSRTWRVLFESVKVPKRTVKKTEWPNLGFDRCPTIDAARELCKSLNAHEKIKRQEEHRNGVMRRLDSEGLSRCAYLPAALVKEFESGLRDRKIRAEHWRTALKGILVADIPPSEWKEKCTRFYDWFRDNAYSIDYVNTLRRAINTWGEFYTDRRGERFKPLPPPTGQHRISIMLAYEAYRPKLGQKGRRRPSGRLSFKHLATLKDKFTASEWNGLFVSISFGLRPEEIQKSLRTPGKSAVAKDRSYIKVYQYKMERVEPNPIKRWKKIEVKTSEQRQAVEIIRSGGFILPRTQKLTGLIDSRGREIDLYGGRKEFYPTMSKLFGKASVQDWMGHMSSDTGKRFYDDVEENAPDEEEDLYVAAARRR